MRLASPLVIRLTIGSFFFFFPRKDIQGRKQTHDPVLVFAPSGVTADLVLERHLHLTDVTRNHSSKNHQVPGDRIAAKLDCHLKAGVLIVALAIIPCPLLYVLTVLQELVDAVKISAYECSPPCILKALVLQIVHNVSNLSVQALLLPSHITVHGCNVSGIESTRVNSVQIDVSAVNQVPHDVGPSPLSRQHQRGETLFVQAAVHVCPFLHAVLHPGEVAHDNGILNLLVHIRQRVHVLAPMNARA
mmetsp:Transcript_886/g.934  ORF Transcript_886/g.934 Transcript_886/m.934 type:complete len:246 (-) Transcript_886:164-901(-)